MSDPKERFISIDKWVWGGFGFKENPNLRYADPQLFAQEAINLSTNDNITMKDNSFIPLNVRMPSVNTQHI